MKKILTRTFTLLLAAAFVLSIQQKALAQVKIGDNPTTIDPSSLLELESADQGFLITRIALSSTATAAPLAGHVVGMMVYNTATAGDVTPGLYYNDGSQWVRVVDVDNNGIYTGDGTAPADVDVTVTDNIDFDANTLFIDGTNNQVGIGKVPVEKLNISEDNSALADYNPAQNGQFFASIRLDDPGNKGTGIHFRLFTRDNFIGSVYDITNNTIPLVFGIDDGGGSANAEEAMRIVPGTRRVGINIQVPEQQLHVGGNIQATGSFISGTTTYPDYVFENYFDGKSDLNKEYEFTSLAEVESFIKQHKHLPGVKSYAEVAANNMNISLTEVSVKNLEKIEELYLHTIEQEKKINEQAAQLNAQQAQINELKKLVQTLLDK